MGPLWMVLGESRAALGRFWALLGGSWGDLGPLLGALGPSWDGLGGHLGTYQSQDRKPVAPRQFPQTFRVDFGSQNGTPNDPKSSQKSRRKMDHVFIPLGRVLERSWVDFGPRLGVKKMVFPSVLRRFLKNRHFRQKNSSRCIMDPT